ncbi:protein of unknown function [Georgfuchsia toluolica]|uniref:DUF2934 domain-containing protein n=1 Tax=Georgfuchsia toluolica TaxID=424218 RepID=A0A916J675_9PROT|nr:DUF2934 domain-containing protein [Georgfuchsia toluolica]CAG4883161.1 protein of unknown function [Georgfuchsia toluolica]
MSASVVTPAVKPATILHSGKPMQKTRAKASKSGKAIEKPGNMVTKQSKTRKANGALSDAERRNYVEVAAYYIAQRRGFRGGSELEDWIQAELDIDRLSK